MLIDYLSWLTNKVKEKLKIENGDAADKIKRIKESIAKWKEQLKLDVELLAQKSPQLAKRIQDIVQNNLEQRDSISLDDICLKGNALTKIAKKLKLGAQTENSEIKEETGENRTTQELYNEITDKISLINDVSWLVGETQKRQIETIIMTDHNDVYKRLKIKANIEKWQENLRQDYMLLAQKDPKLAKAIEETVSITLSQLPPKNRGEKQEQTVIEFHRE